MHRRLLSLIATVVVIMIAAQPALAGVRFRVAFPDPIPMPEAGLDGRLIVYVVHAEGRRLPLGQLIFQHPQPIYSIPITNAQPGMDALVADQANSFPDVPSALPPGDYRAMAVFRRVRANSSWRLEPGNIWADKVKFTVRDNQPDTEVRLILRANTGDAPPMPRVLHLGNAEHVEIESESLRDADGAIRTLRATVLPPLNLDTDAHYPTLYHIDGFGGDYRVSANNAARLRTRLPRNSIERRIHESAFHVYLDPEGPFGHHLFADSANNGPVATALVEELIPTIEQLHPKMIREPDARILTGHSSGAWSSIWLVLNHPETFGACFVTAPDPVDFRSFQNSHIYEDTNIYFDEAGREKPVYRWGGEVRMTVREENLMERAIGPGAWSAQQWASWHAVFGPRDRDGEPALLFDQFTGNIDPAIARHWRQYDTSALLRDDPDRYLPLWRERIRMVVGTHDAFYLERPARLLWKTIADLSSQRNEHAIAADGVPAITFAPDHTHATVRRSDDAKRLQESLAKRLESSIRQETP